MPFGATSTPGNTDIDFEGGPLDIRGQSVYGRGQFINAGVAGPVLITQFAFRAEAGLLGPASLSATSVDIYASTSSYALNSNFGNTLITDTFAANLGPDNTLVFSGPLAVSSPGCAGTDVCPFDLVFAFDTPIQYDPTQGFLLLDIHLVGFSGSGSANAARFNAPGGSIAGVVGMLGDQTGEIDLSGIVTQFTFVAVLLSRVPVFYYSVAWPCWRR